MIGAYGDVAGGYIYSDQEVPHNSIQLRYMHHKVCYSALLNIKIYKVIWTFSDTFEIFSGIPNGMQTFRLAKLNIMSPHFLFFFPPTRATVKQQQQMSAWATSLTGMRTAQWQNEQCPSWENYRYMRTLPGRNERRRQRWREKETCEEVGQHRIISTALSSVKSMVVKLQVRAGWAALSLTAECVLGNNPLLTSSTCHWGNAPFVTIYTEAALSG